MNSEKYGFDGGDCKRENQTISTCNEKGCCDDVNAWVIEICTKRACDCTKQEGSFLCSEIFCCPTTPETITNGTTTPVTPETTTPIELLSL